ncbi:MAG: hypothetical protein PHE83_04850 [Opitutaceae bacterium]|nr:hypothetical protein [Opitutaceae bacterium]
MSELRECWAYWTKNIKTAKERFEMVSSLLAFIVAAVIFGLQWFDIRADVFAAFLNSRASTGIGALAFSYSFLTFCIWLPYKRDKEKTKIIVQMERQLNALVIHSAIWHAEGATSDVTDIALKHLSAEGHFEMPCDIALLKDPSEGHPKCLTIDFTMGGKRSKRHFDEHKIARLP